MTEPTREPLPRRDTGSPWHWLLIVPVAVPLLVFLYDGKNPYLFGFPRFYWLQLAFILLGVVTTTLVYQLTKRSGAPAPARVAAAGPGPAADAGATGDQADSGREG